MTHEEIVTFEVARLAKEKGFNLYCVPFYALEDFTAEYVDNVGAFYEVDFEKGDLYLNYPVRGPLYKDKMLPAPTQSLLQRWLREEKGFIVCVALDTRLLVEECKVRYGWVISNKTAFKCGKYDTKQIITDKRFDVYEEALEDALKYTLENLV